MNNDFEIAVTLDTYETNKKLDAITAKAQALADLFTSIAEQADRATKIMPPSSVVDAVYAMRHGCPPTTNFMRSISEMLRISLPGFEKMESRITWRGGTNRNTSHENSTADHAGNRRRSQHSQFPLYAEKLHLQTENSPCGKCRP